MKTKKASGVIAAVGVCILLAFSVAVFPFILAASPDNREITTIETETVFPSEDSERDDEIGLVDETEEPDMTEESDDTEDLSGQEAIHNINAISKEMAIEIAMEAIGFPGGTYHRTSGESVTITRDFIEAKYIESADPADDPSWYVLFSTSSLGTLFEYIPLDLTPEEYIASRTSDPSIDYFTSDDGFLVVGIDNNGSPVIITHYARTGYVVAEIDAFTGEFIGYGTTLDEIVSLDDFSNGNELKQNMIYTEAAPGPAPVPE